MPPETKYAKSGDVHIAYQVIGNGPLDLVVVPGWVSHLELTWEEPTIARFVQRLASFSRVILFDKRGTGISDRVAETDLPTLEQRMDDVRAVMEAAGSKRAALFGISEGGPMCVLFAATYPERTSALVMYGAYPKLIGDESYPWALTREEHERAFKVYEKRWGTPVGLSVFAPSVYHDDQFRQAWAKILRMSASPAAAIALYRMNVEVDVRNILSTIRVPTLILHRSGDRLIDIRGARFMAERIPHAKFVELSGGDHLFYVGDTDAILNEVEEFLTGVRHAPEPDRVLATVMFTDIVRSTEHASEMGDSRWRDVLQSHHAVIRRELARFRGREIDTAGDGFFATFDGPARAINCALAAIDGVRQLGIEIRAGLHTGEIERMGDKVGGIAVHIGARVMASADANEVLVSSTVKDLVAGSGIQFQDRGMHTLKGVAEEWHLYAVQG